MKDRLTLPTLLLIFVILAAGIVTAGCFYYRSQQDRYRTEVEHNLAAVADLKVGELSAWRTERLADAGVFFGNTAFSDLVRRCIERPQELFSQEELRSWLSRVQTSYRYDRVALLDATGNERILVPDTKEPICAVVKKELPEALRAGQPVFVDFHRHEHSQKIGLGLLVPLLDTKDGGQPMGAVVLEIDPNTYLYPFIQRWPTPSATAETLLVRREGSEAVFLNELKFQKNTALTLRMSLENRDAPAVKAALGEEGVGEGIDYRRVPVLAAVRSVPDSPWFMVARMDAAEVNAPMRERLWQTVLLVVVLLLGAAAGVGMVWQGQIARFNRERAAAAETLREANENLDITLKSIGDAVIATDAAGKIVRMNPIAETLTGWTLAEAIGRPLREVFRIINAQTRQPVVDPVAKVLETGYIVGLANHTALIARDGTERQIADSASPIRNNAGQIQGVVLIFRDVTDEYAAAERLRLLDRAINATAEGICTTGPSEAGNPLVYVNHGFEQLTGYPAEEVLGQNMRLLQGADTDRVAVDRVRAAIESEQDFTTELLNYRKDGTPFWNQISITPVRDAAGKVSHLVAVLHDLTERKRAEEALRASEERFRRAVVDSPFPILLHAEDGAILHVSNSWREITGYTREELATIADWTERAYGERKAIVQADIDALYELDQSKHEGDYVIRTKSGGTRIWEFSSAPLGRLPDGRRLVISMAIDVTDRRRVEEALRDSEVQYRRLFEAAKDGILVLDAETGMILDVNPFLVEMLGHSHEQFLGKRIWELGFFRDIVANQANFVTLQQQEYIRYEDMPLETADGQQRDVEFVSNVYQVDHRKIVQCNIRDITERNRAQEALRELLREKQSLLKEVHHRVKNNLQVISSLMRLQSAQVDNSVAQAALRDMQNRIGSMALLHETLYKSGSFARVDLATYLRSLCSQLFHSLVANPESIQLRLDVASVSLELSQAVPCGLLINELVSNCLKHAFPDGRAGEVRVEIQSVDDGPAVRLRVADNGAGLPADFDLEQLQSLGLQLVS
ncbi:MAG: PAS domain S-box protein, partial [Thermoguttaceae bacterium]